MREFPNPFYSFMKGGHNMDARAAKGIAANLRIIAQATATAMVTKEEETKANCKSIIDKAEGVIAEWFQQPMTWR